MSGIAQVLSRQDFSAISQYLQSKHDIHHCRLLMTRSRSTKLGILMTKSTEAMAEFAALGRLCMVN